MSLGPAASVGWHGRLETRVGLKLKIENLGSAGKKGEDAMDVGMLSKGKPKGKGKGKYIGVFSEGKGKGNSKGNGKRVKKGHGKGNYTAKSGSSSATAVCFNAGSQDISKRIASWPKAKEKANHPKVERKA